ncbi:GNAT family N-acetyltransferase [Candidatus Poriferisodalis sp.]|uniref:GNAT family N-acetyltransferase n=1 Tax=Candidatus Poriferisodalis sp. TaxID=3101277 RepID=UPI003B029CBE
MARKLVESTAHFSHLYYRLRLPDADVPEGMLPMRHIDAVSVGKQSGLRYAQIQPAWAAELEALELSSHPTADPHDLYDESAFDQLARDFPEGCFAGFDGDRLVAMGVGIRCNFDPDDPLHTIADIVPSDHSGSGHLRTGRWYYGTSIATRPEYRRRGIGGELYELRKQVCVDLGLEGIVAGGVMPGYADHKAEMSADEYIARVRAGELYDRTLSFQIDNGFEAVCGLPNYLSDPATDSWAALIMWRNPRLATRP